MNLEVTAFGGDGSESVCVFGWHSRYPKVVFRIVQHLDEFGDGCG